MATLVTDLPVIDALRQVPGEYELRLSPPIEGYPNGFIVVRDPKRDLFVQFNAAYVTGKNIDIVLRQLESAAAYRDTGGEIA